MILIIAKKKIIFSIKHATVVRRGYSIWKKLVRLAKFQCFLLFEILTCFTSCMYHYQSAGIRIRDMPRFFPLNWSVRLYRVGAQMCFANSTLNLSGKIQILKCWLTVNYSKYIISGHYYVIEKWPKFGHLINTYLFLFNFDFILW